MYKINLDMTSDVVERVTALYEDILQRKPDKTGLYYFVSRVTKKQLTIDDVKKILSESEEAKSLKEYTHYSDKYWNDLEIVVKYKNKLATGNENVHWIGDILNRFKEYLPFDDVLVVGCGNGWLERQLYDLGIGNHFDAFDMSEKYVNEAKELKQSRAIDYFLDDILDDFFSQLGSEYNILTSAPGAGQASPKTMPNGGFGTVRKGTPKGVQNDPCLSDIPHVRRRFWSPKRSKATPVEL